jgi:hypothetical protein
VLLGALCALPAPAQEGSQLDRVLNEIVANERGLSGTLSQYEPLVETYIQTVKPDAVLGSLPIKDRYFLGRLQLPEPSPDGKARKKNKKNQVELFTDFQSVLFKPDSFARMLILDNEAFDREHYHFEFVRREFLGEIRTLVFEVSPKASGMKQVGRFTGRIWVDDQGHSIVRYNGIYASALDTTLHFDSWRINTAPGVWLPAYVYTEEAERSAREHKYKHKGQTRVWGYEIKRRTTSEEEFTKVFVEAELTSDESETSGQISPVESFRAWEREAEDNVLRRLERAGLLAPHGPVSEVLETVVANIELTNELDIQPPIRARVLLTTPLESFTVGHTIVLSRGLIDVLPDEASLAMALAHELGHILSGHQLDTKYAFSDQMLVADRDTIEQFRFERDPGEELEADEKAVELLQNSPYKDDLESAGLFLKELSGNVQGLPALIRPHFGNRMAKDAQLFRLTAIVDAAPELDPMNLTQISALPLGGRVKVDPWSARIELMKSNRVALLSPREKMPFQITPLMPHLVRYGTPRDPLADADRNTNGETGNATVAAGRTTDDSN